MSRPRRRVWTWFAACVAALFVGLSVVSVVAWSMDSERRESQRRAVHEEQVRLALWRLDSALTPILVRESGRTHRQFVAPDGEALPDEVVLRFARSQSGEHVIDPRAPADARDRFEREVDRAWLEGAVPSPGTQIDGGEADKRGMLARASSEGQRELDDGIVDQVAAAPQQKKAPIPLPEQQSVAYQSTVSDNEFQRRVQNLQKNSPGYGGSVNYANNADWAWNGARRVDDDRNDVNESYRGDASERAPSASKGGKLRGSVEGVASAVEDKLTHEPLFVRESVMAALWHQDMLLLARRAEAEDGRWIEGTWLDWAELEASLRAEISDLLPDAQLEPVRDQAQDTSRLLATLPVRLLPGPMPEVEGPTFTAMRVAIASAWFVALVVLVAAWYLLRATLELSERRGAFVSAVTHELRTPLTTFRMYTEMLADGMVQDAERQRSYIETLRGEAHRLDNLVQNVLTYARIEDDRAQAQVERMSVASLVEGLLPRLEQRANEGEAPLEVQGLEAYAQLELSSDRTAVEQILFNLVDNAVKYGRAAEDPRIRLEVAKADGQLSLRVCDNGPGIPEAERRRVFRPFEKAEAHAAGTVPGVGLGLALCLRLAKQLGGSLRLVEREGAGACFELCLPLA